MSLKIFTYVNPYELENEEYWDDIRCCPHFCVSQTLVNGLKSVCKSFEKNNISTIKNFVNHLYKNWDDIGTKVKQLLETMKTLNLQGVQMRDIPNVLMGRIESWYEDWQRRKDMKSSPVHIPPVIRSHPSS